MKATGIVRRIDDLGRVVIPKEIRRTMRIREGDPLEIYTDHDGEVIFKKYSPMGELGTFVGELCESISKTTNLSCAICDRDTVIAAAGSAKKDVYDHPISADLENIMEERRMYEYQHGQPAVHLTGTKSIRWRWPGPSSPAGTSPAASPSCWTTAMCASATPRPSWPRPPPIS